MLTGAPQSELTTATNFDPMLIRIRDLIYSVCGIYHGDYRLAFLQDRCARRMRELSIASLSAYGAFLVSSAARGNNEMKLLLNEITVGETCFFRNLPQLTAIERVVIPFLVQSKAKLSWNNLRIWSAGCSTGEEAYTLAMVLTELQKTTFRDLTWQLFATDLNDRSLAKAQQAVYGPYATRNTPAIYLKKYFVGAQGGDMEVCSEIRSKVTFRQMNLLNDSGMVFMKSMDIILCCNVLIYFDLVSKRRVIEHFYSNLLPGGYLFLGHSESLFGVNPQFHLVHFPGATGYWKPLAHTVPRGPQ